jgi:hypothetical protein
MTERAGQCMVPSDKKLPAEPGNRSAGAHETRHGDMLGTTSKHVCCRHYLKPRSCRALPALKYCQTSHRLAYNPHNHRP